MINIVIAGKDETARRGLNTVLGLDSDLNIIGSFDGGVDCVSQILKTQPDVVVTSKVPDEPDGIELTKLIKQSAPKVHVVVVTSQRDDLSLFSALRAGVDAASSKTMMLRSWCMPSRVRKPVPCCWIPIYPNAWWTRR